MYVELNNNDRSKVIEDTQTIRIHEVRIQIYWNWRSRTVQYQNKGVTGINKNSFYLWSITNKKNKGK